jgi:hypothetical protein
MTCVERKTGFEPATSTLARLRSSQLSYFRETTHCTTAIWRTKSARHLRHVRRPCEIGSSAFRLYLRSMYKR